MGAPGASGFLVRTQTNSLQLRLSSERDICLEVPQNFISDLENNLSDVTPKIINISKYDLNNAEISLLSKGKKYVPDPISKDLLDLRVDINEFIRKIQLLDEFGNNTNSQNQNINNSIVKKTGEYIPFTKDPFLLYNVKELKNKFCKSLWKLPVKRKLHSNITTSERKAITSLSRNNDIIIRSVDKGGAIVVMDTTYYVSKVQECLRNTNTYEKLNNYDPSLTMKLVTKFCEKFKNTLTDKERLYLQKFNFKTSNFYGNPKIHKSKKIAESIQSFSGTYIKITEEVDLDFRFITTSINSPTSKLSELLDILLKPFLPLAPSYIRDATDFLNKKPTIKDNCSDLADIVFVTCDIQNMYPNLTLKLGQEAIEYWLDTHPHLLQGRFNKDIVLEGLSLVMSSSCFQFNDECYALKTGTATGTTVAPTYANLIMAFLETKLYSLVLQHFGNEVHNYVIKNWFRFLDDGIILWKKSFGEITPFIEILNSLNSKLSFTYETSEEKISFLNVLLYKENNSLKTDIFYKKTDSHDYLPFGSCHPRHTKQNIPYTLARMICTIVDDPTRKNYRLAELKRWLLKSGYPPKVINSKFNLLRNVDTNILRQKVINEKKQQLIFVTTRNPENPHVFNRLRSFVDHLKTNERMSKILDKVEIIKSERQPKNLGVLLQPSYLGTKMFDFGVTKCGGNPCITCSYIEEGVSVYFPHADTHFQIKHKFNCNSGYLLYKIRCKGCNVDIPGCNGYYIGRTTCLKDRLAGHRLGVTNKNYRTKKIYQHIFACAGHLEIPFTIMPFYKVKRETLSEMQIFEDHFIEKFKPDLNTL